MLVTSKTRTPTGLIGALAALGLAGSIAILPACGGDDGGGQLDEAAFCELVERELFAATDAELHDVVRNLAGRAPTAELADALNTFADIDERLEALDIEDDDDFEEWLDLTEDGSFYEAVDAIGAYVTDVCGLSNAVD